ncbi:MAG: hypothetical protein Q8K45_10680 [Rubrivivax sp.]|nr:hypothetical protein [Rubrivivax sp.]
MNRTPPTPRLLTSVAGLLAAAALAASAATPGAQALRDTVVATPAHGLPYADLLLQAGDTTNAELLRLGLLTAHIQALDTAAAPAPVRLGDAIDRAVGQPAPGPDAPLARQWARVFPGQVALQWAPLAGPWPPDLAYLQTQLQPLGPGAWWMNVSGQVRYLASVKLVNRSPTPLPLDGFGLRITQGAQALDMACRPPADAASAQRGVLASTLPPLPVGGDRAFVCRATHTGEWKEVLARLSSGRPAPGDSATLLPQHFDQALDVMLLARAIGSAHPVDRDAWAQRLAPATASAAVAGPATAHPAQTGPAVSSPARTASLPLWRAKLYDRIWPQDPWGRASIAVLAMFVVGRLLVRIGVHRLAVYLTTVLLLALAGVTTAVSAWAKSSGGGYWGWLGDLLGAMSLLGPFIAVGTVVLALHAVADMLASEGLSWTGSVTRALRRTLDYRSSAGRGEFWGYVGFCLLAWVSVRALYAPASLPLGLLLGLPMLALAWRRVNGMDRRERRELVRELGDTLRKAVSRR